MKKKLSARFTALALCLLMSLAVLAGCNSSFAPALKDDTPPPASTPAPTAAPVSEDETAPESPRPKYIFLFIGDGMSYVQVNAAQVFLGSKASGEVKTQSPNFTEFPVSGNVTTYDSTSFRPASASTATALSCGVKTHSGVIGLEVDKATRPESITEILKDRGMKIGIVSTVTINHATPLSMPI